LIERSLFEERPAFFVTAGRRGGGKSTLIIMLTMGVIGLRPVASAWSTNEEERRKTLLSLFIPGAPYILWDNITRGSQISCPHIERSCTTKLYQDRKLGVSEAVATSASTIHFFTGNNIGPRGDLASRSLCIRLAVDRPDPENREFKHPNPIGWTGGHRAEILRALYTILLGNPQLKMPEDAPGKTRFKMWWRMVGSAVEHAAKLYTPKPKEGSKPEEAAKPVDFETLFLTQEEEDDEETLSLAEALDIMRHEWPVSFHATTVATFIQNGGNQNATALRDFLYPGALPGFVAAPRSVGKQLKKRIDEPVKKGEETLTLKRSADTDNKTHGVMSYYIEVKPPK
jgi:hypothetical protein